MSERVVRRALAHELEAVGALTVAAYRADGHLTRADGSPDEHYAGFLADAAGRALGGEVLVAVAGERLLGTITWCPPGSTLRELSTSATQAEVRTLAVAPDARGLGVAGLLVDRCLAEARELGLREVLLCSLPTMEMAHRLYRSRGFGRRAELDWSPAEGVRLWAFSLDL